MYSSTAFDSRHDLFSSYSKTDYKPPFMSLRRKRKIDKKFLIELVSDYDFTNFTLNFKFLLDHKLDPPDLDRHRYHYNFYSSNCTGGSGGCMVMMIAYLLLVLSFLTANFLLILSAASLLGLIVLYQRKQKCDESQHYPDPSDSRFDRFTGMLQLFEEGKLIEVPFHELDVYYYTTPTIGSYRYVFYLVHRHSHRAYGLGMHSHFHAAMGEISYLIRFMDTSKPLPNVPILALDRHKDQTSAQAADFEVTSQQEWETTSNDEWTERSILSGDKLKSIYGSR